jgi:hypothetical protein
VVNVGERDLKPVPVNLGALALAVAAVRRGA